MCSQSCVGISHTHEHRGGLSNVEERALFPRLAKAIQEVNVRGRPDHSARRMKLLHGPGVHLGTGELLVPTFWVCGACPRGAYQGSDASQRAVRRKNGALGENSLATSQVSYLLFIMLPFPMPTCFLLSDAALLRGKGGTWLDVSGSHQGRLAEWPPGSAVTRLSCHRGWAGLGILLRSSDQTNSPKPQAIDPHR